MEPANRSSQPRPVRLEADDFGVDLDFDLDAGFEPDRGAIRLEGTRGNMAHNIYYVN